MFRVEGKYLAETLTGLVRPVPLTEENAEPVVGVNSFRVELGRLAQRGDGLLGLLLQFHQRAADAVLDVAVVRVEGDRLAKGDNGLERLLLIQENKPETPLGREVIRLKFEARLEAGDGVIQAVLPVPRAAQSPAAFDVLGGKF